MTIDTKMRSSLKKAGITEAMKAELDALALQAMDAQFEADRTQAVVNSITEKYNNFQNYLALTDSMRTQALTNKNTINELVQSALNLQINSSIAFDNVLQADQEMKSLASQITNVMNKLVYSAEIINKLSNLVIRKKASNPLISDDLISLFKSAGYEVNNAVSLTLISFQSVFAAQASAIKSEQALALEYLQAKELLKVLTGLTLEEMPDDGAIPVSKTDKSLYALLHCMYDTATANYETAIIALDAITRQLNMARARLNRSQIKLKSLQAGLAAANAAVLAS